MAMSNLAHEGHSGRRRQRKSVAAINVTPLVDVLLILLVLLMLAMPMYLKRLPVDLPRTELGGAPAPRNALAVTLLPGNKLRMDTAEVTKEQLLSRVGPGVTVELAIDRSVTYDDIAQLISAMQERRPADVVLITR